MSSQFDASEFIDDDLHPTRKPAVASSSLPAMPIGVTERRAASRDEMESKVSEMQQRLAELKTEQQRLERERAALEETRRRQTEFTSGRQEVIQNLTRGIAQLEEGELSHRREAELRTRSLADMREALSKVVSVSQETWNKETLEIELTRALTVVDNARMEWNSARVKFGELNGESSVSSLQAAPTEPVGSTNHFVPQKFSELCRLGFAINWPLFLLGLVIFLMLWLRR